MSPLNIFQISVGLDRGMWVIAGVTERYQVQSCGWSLAEQWIIFIAPWFFFYFFRVSEIQTSWADLAKVVFLFRLINGWWKKKKEINMAGTVAADFPQSTSSSAVFYSLLIPAALLWFVYWRLSRRRLYELAEKLPGPKGLPFIGNALDLTGTSHSKWSLMNTNQQQLNPCARKEVTTWYLKQASLSIFPFEQREQDTFSHRCLIIYFSFCCVSLL